MTTRTVPRRPLAAPGKAAQAAANASNAKAKRELPKHLQGFGGAKSFGSGEFFDASGTFKVRVGLIKHDEKADDGDPYFLSELKVIEVITQDEMDRVADGEAPRKKAKEGEMRTFWQGFKYDTSAWGAIKAFLKRAWQQQVINLMQNGVDLETLRDDIPNIVAAVIDREAEELTDEDVGNEELAMAIDESEAPLTDVELICVVGKKLKKGEKGPSKDSFRNTFRWYTLAEYEGGAAD